MKIRCMLCGRPIKDEFINPNPIDDEDDEMPKKKPMLVCLMCEAKLKHEADEAQKIPKPI
ncbi:MAG: hypothetical protein HPY89_08300 [Pelotomaculum sp.]|nr:hypothetical protein [Pelotomaculum sp.]